MKQDVKAQIADTAAALLVNPYSMLLTTAIFGSLIWSLSSLEVFPWVLLGAFVAGWSSAWSP